MTTHLYRCRDCERKFDSPVAPTDPDREEAVICPGCGADGRHPSESDPDRDVEVPVKLLFRAPTSIDPDQIAQAVEAILEHGTVRDCFYEGFGGHPDPIMAAHVAYDGYGFPQGAPIGIAPA